LAGVAARPPEYPDEPVPRRQAIDLADIDLYGEVDANWLAVPHSLSHGILVVLQTLATAQERPPNRYDVAKRFSQAWFAVPNKAVGTALSTLAGNGLVDKTADESSTQCRKAYPINAAGSANLAALPEYNAHWTKVYGNYANGTAESYPEPEFGESTS
jgi:DNA-binding PadR family transcriptional regulator